MSLLEQLKIKHPLFLAPMAGVTTPTLAAEVANQGGLGALGLGASTLSSAKQQILATKALTQASFQVNFFCHQSQICSAETTQNWLQYIQACFPEYAHDLPSQLECIYPSFLDNDDFLKLILETKPAAASFHFGIPHPHQIAALQAAGIVTMVTATNLAEAQQIEAAGIDIIIAQGIEAGGHRGIFNPDLDGALHTSDLVVLLRQHCKIPIVAAGGIMNGIQAQHMLRLGASAVQLGTAFVQCRSSNANAAYRQALFNQPLTQITRSISGRPARGIINHWQHHIDTPQRPDVPPYPYAYDLGKHLHAVASQQQDFGFGAFWAGSAVAQIRALEAADLINLLLLEMRQAQAS